MAEAREDFQLWLSCKSAVRKKYGTGNLEKETLTSYT